MKIPKKLQMGDTVAIISPSFAGPNIFHDRYAAGCKQLEAAFGVCPISMKHTFITPKKSTKHPELRAQDLMDAFKNPDVKAIIASIGWEDSIRLLPYIDFNIIQNNPKILLGYSDITILHFMCYYAWLRSYYGPTIMAWFAENNGIFPYMQQSLQKTLFSDEKIGKITANSSGWTNEFLDWTHPQNQQISRKLQPSQPWKILQKWKKNSFSGKLLWGCLDTFYFLWETKIWPKKDDWKGKILFFELSEENMPVDMFRRIIRSLGVQEILQNLNGILVGRYPNENDYNETLLQVIQQEFWLYNLPIITNMDFGHTDPMFTIPIGAEAKFCCDSMTLEILESWVL